MRIAQVAPLYESVPPTRYGGTERVVSYLTEELVRLGHEVTLFASGDSDTSARLIPCCQESLWHDGQIRLGLPCQVHEIAEVLRRASEFDLIHFHVENIHLPLLRGLGVPNVTTVHGLIEPDLAELLTRDYPDAALISISDEQRTRAPRANWVTTVHHGLPLDLHTFVPRPDEYLVFVGRISPEKRLDRAIEIALGSGHRLKVAARINLPDTSGYYTNHIKPLLDGAGPTIEFLGEVGGSAKDELIGRAKAMLFPIDWAEPFGLVMIESLATGTPVIAFRRGSVPEVIRDGVSGFVVEDVAQAVEAVRKIGRVDRRVCRQAFERSFSVERMAQDYLEAYERLLGRRRLRLIGR